MSNYQERIKKVVDNLGIWVNDEKIVKCGKMSKKLYPYQNLFSPIQINGIKVKNRIVMAPMGNISMAEETGRPNEKMVRYFEERAKGGVGLITSGLIPISHGIDPTVTELNNLSYFPRIDKSRTKFSGWRNIAQKCHAYGAKFFIQLTPGLGRVGSPECLINKFKMPVSGGFNPNFYISKIPCRPLKNSECWKIIKNAGQAAADSKTAGIDGVYLHGHEGYLLEQMTNRAFNKKILGYFSDWQAFGVEIVKEIRKRVGDRYPIMYRIDLSLALNETYKKRMDKVFPLKKFKHERKVDQTLDYMKNLVKAGVDIFDVDLGCYDNWWLPHPPGGMPPKCFEEVAKITKEFFKKENIKSNVGMEVPIVAVGKLGYPDTAEQCLIDKSCDMVMLGRPLLADPQWPNKVYAGDVEKICPCIGDQEGCINEFVEGGHPQCSVNARTGFEEIYDGSELRKTEKVKKVAVIGGGPTGIQTATILAKRGHDVTLFEKSDKLGGMLIPGSSPKMKFDVENYLNYLLNCVEIAKKSGNLKVKLKSEISAESIKKQSFDVVISATGTKNKKLSISGLDGKNVAQAIDVLRNPKIVEDYKNILIIGGGDVGCETAHMLAVEYGKKVKIIEMLPHFMKGSCTANRGYLIHHLEELGVELINCATLKEVRENFAIVEQNISNTVPDPYNSWQPILPENIHNPFEVKIKKKLEIKAVPADFIILSTGVDSDDGLYYSFVKQNIAKEVYNIGDSFKPGRILEATRAAYHLAIAI